MVSKAGGKPAGRGISISPSLHPPLETTKKGELRFPLLGTSPKLSYRQLTGGEGLLRNAFAARTPPQAPRYFGGMAPMAARRAKPVQRSSFLGLQGNPDACRPRRGVVGPSYGSFAFGQARKLIPSAALLPSRQSDYRAKAARQSRRSFFPARFIRHWRRFAGKLLSPPNPLRSRWRLCRLTDAACPLRVLRWASAGAPVTASASQWGGRQCTPGSCQPVTAHRRHEPRLGGPGGAKPPGPSFPPFLREEMGAPAGQARPARGTQAWERGNPSSVWPSAIHLPPAGGKASGG